MAWELEVQVTGIATNYSYVDLEASLGDRQLIVIDPTRIDFKAKSATKVELGNR